MSKIKKLADVAFYAVGGHSCGEVFSEGVCVRGEAVPADVIRMLRSHPAQLPTKLNPLHGGKGSQLPNNLLNIPDANVIQPPIKNNYFFRC